MRVKSIRKIKLTEPIRMFDITVEQHHNFSVGNSNIISHNSSLAGAINKLAKPFACSEQMLIGDGFFGTPVSPRPASPRYTQIKISKQVDDLLDRYAPVNVKNAEGGNDWLHVDVPLGLMTHIVGIAVGYASNILPRKLSDVQEYLDGKPKLLKPHFKGFDGKISKHKDAKSGWVLEGVVERDDQRMTIHIKSLPPLMRYDSFIGRLYEKMAALNDRGKVDNNSTTETDVTVRWFDQATWKDLVETVDKMTKMIVVENIVFVRDGMVVVYDQLTDYLDEFKVHREQVIHRRMEYDLVVMNDELEFLRAKVEFMKFMMAKKRKSDEIKKWMSDYPQKIRVRLDTIKLTSLSEETLKDTEAAILKIVSDIAEQKKTVSKQLAVAKLAQKSFKGKGRIAMQKSVPLFDEPIVAMDGIEVFNPEDEVPTEEDADLDAEVD